MEVGWKIKDEYNYILFYEVFLTFAVKANQKYSKDNSKVSTILHSNMFNAVVAFLLIWTVT